MLLKDKFSPGLQPSVSLVDEKPSEVQLVVQSAKDEVRSILDNLSDASASPGAEPFIAPGPSKPAAHSTSLAHFEPKQFGPYQLVWELCKDALSTTWAARREGVDLLSVRIFNERVTAEAEVKRVVKAARSAAELTHFNILTVYECGISSSGAPYVVSSFVEAESLAQEIALDKRLDIGRLLHIINQVCEALIEAHSRQLLHNNLSPEKILLVNEDSDADLVKVIDFGMPPDPVKNAFYLSPEQCLDRKKVGERSDIYALGCVMYEALTGKPPFTGYSMSQTSLNHLHELANHFSPDSPEHNALKLLDCIIVKCLQKKPFKRFGSVRELKDALALVDACIRGGCTKKLPPRAEKLLLFRFLDLFDRKIFAALFAYLLLGMVALKFNAETQLQKYIDEAQLAVFSGDLPRAEQDWRLAIQQAQWARKPPSMLADLHWELADCLESSANEAVCSNNKSDGLTREAIAQYEEALKYFSIGSHFRSSAIQLLQTTGMLWSTLDIQSWREDRRNAVRKQAGALYQRGKYAECASLCANFLNASDLDHDICQLASRAYNSIAESLPPKKALRFFERSAYYHDLANNSSPQNNGFASGGENPYENLLICKAKLQKKTGKVLDSIELAAKALAEGDIEAAKAEISSDASTTGSGLAGAIDSERQARTSAYIMPTGSSSLKPAINAWERALRLQEEAYGKASPKLSIVLSMLANANRLSGEDKKAMQFYSRYFELNKESMNHDQLIQYVDLLTRHKQYDKVRKLLLTAIQNPDGSINSDNELYVRLIKAYADCRMKEKAEEAISVFEYKPSPLAAYTYRTPPPLPSTPVVDNRDEFEQ